MPFYSFQAVDELGAPLAGEIEAPGRAEARDRLESRGLRVEVLRTASIGRKVAGDDLVEFARHVASLSDAGLALPGGLRALADEGAPRRLRRALRVVADRVEAGDPLDEAMADQGARFPEALRALVNAGLRSVRLAECLGFYIEQERRSAALRWRLQVALLYPLLLITLLTIVFLFLSQVVVLPFMDVLKDFGVTVPWITRLLFRAAESFQGASWDLAIGAALGGAFIWLGLGQLAMPGRHRAASGVPMIGKFWRWSARSEYASLLALLIDAALPLPLALRLAGKGVNDAVIDSASGFLAREVAGGRPLAEALSIRGLFPREFPPLIAWGEKAGALAESWQLVAEVCDARARAQAELIAAVAYGASMILVVQSAAFLLLGLYLPMIQLLQSLSM